MILFRTFHSRRVVLAVGGAALMACATERAPEAGHTRDSLVARPVAVIASAPPQQPDSSATRGADRQRSTQVRSPVATKPRRVIVGGIDLTGIGYDRGSSSAPVVMIDLSDFACPYCAEFSKDTYPAIGKSVMMI